MTKRLFICLIMGLIILPSGCTTGPRGFPPEGIQNFDKVDSHVLRGAQFNNQGFEWLKNRYHQSAKPLTVLNLRQSDSWVDEPILCRKNGVRYFNVPLNALAAPSKADTERALAIIQSAPGFVYVHCQFGCDRTGTIIACYRIRQGMKPDDALNDAKAHGLSSWETGMISFIRGFK